MFLWQSKILNKGALSEIHELFFIFQGYVFSIALTFLSNLYKKETHCIVGTPPPLYKKEGLEFSKFFQRRGGSDFSHKKGGAGKAPPTVLKRGYHIFTQTNPFCHLSGDNKILS